MIHSERNQILQEIVQPALFIEVKSILENRDRDIVKTFLYCDHIDMFVPSTNCTGVCLVCLSFSSKVPNDWSTKRKEKRPCQFSVGKQGLNRAAR